MSVYRYEIDLLKTLNIFLDICQLEYSGRIGKFFAREKSTLKAVHIVTIHLSDLEQDKKSKIITYAKFLFTEQSKYPKLAPILRVLLKENYLIIVFARIEGDSIYSIVHQKRGVYPSKHFQDVLNQLSSLFDLYHKLGLSLDDQSLRSIIITEKNEFFLQEWGLGYINRLLSVSNLPKRGILSPFKAILPKDIEYGFSDNVLLLFLLLVLFEGSFVAFTFLEQYRNFDNLHDKCRNLSAKQLEFFTICIRNLLKMYRGRQFRSIYRKINRKTMRTKTRIAFAASLIVGLLCWGFIDYYSQFAKLYFVNLPVDSRVYINGKKTIVEAESFLRLKSGVYDIFCSKEFFSSFRDTVRLEEGVQDTIHVKMSPGANLKLNIEPENALVRIDSMQYESAELANGKMFFLPAGQHIIHMTMNPYVSIADTIKLDKFETLEYKKNLTQLTGILEIKVPASGGKIYLEMDTRYLDVRKADAGYESNLIKLELSEEKWNHHKVRIGHHRLIYEHPEIDNIIKEFEIIAGEKTAVVLQKPKVKAAKKLIKLKNQFLGKETEEQVIPAGRLVINTGFKWHYLNGLGEQYENSRKFISVVEEIPPGEYEVQLLNPHFETFKIKISVRNNMSDSLVVDLSKRTLKKYTKEMGEKKYREFKP
ncbi:MAG: hypothetical protein Kow00108_13840 [Calditrichia bacterium]